MAKFILRLVLFNIPFFLIGIGLLVWGVYTDPTELSSDGYNAKNLIFLIGGSFIILPFLLMGVFTLTTLLKQRRIHNLMETGRQGTAKILKLEDTGVRVNDNPRIKLLLEMHFEGYQPYQAWKKIDMPMIRLPQVQVGETIAVLADPNDPQNQKRIALMLK